MIDRPVRALLINENIGGHATVHHHLRKVAARREDVRIHVIDVPAPGFWRKVAGVSMPGLARFDADLRPARYQIAQSGWVARRLPGWLAGGRDGLDGPPDVVHLYTHNAGLLSRRSLRRVPYVVTIDSTNAQSNLMHPRREPTRFSALSTSAVRPLERAVYANAARVVANSRWCARSLVADYGIDERRIEMLPMGVAVPAASCVPAAGDGLPKVAFIGRTMRRKGGYDLLEVHQRWLSHRCELVLVTQDPVPPGCRVPGLKNVTVLDDVRPGDGRIDALLAGCAMLVLPSRLDQWPNSVMEAMSFGVPPVVSHVGGMAEMVLEGEAGVVLADRRPETLRDAITGLLEDPRRREELGRRARQRVVEDLDVEHTANRLLDVIRDAAFSSAAG